MKMTSNIMTALVLLMLHVPEVSAQRQEIAPGVVVVEAEIKSFPLAAEGSG